MTSTLSIPTQRTLVMLLAIAMALGALLPLAAPDPAAAVSPDVVISEFRVRGPAGAGDEFVELYNGSSSAAAIGGWSLRRSNAAGTVNTQVTFADGTTIGPGCFLLVANSTAYGGTVSPDVSYSVGIADDGGVGVVMADGTVVDAVGMSPTSFYREGTTLAPLTTNVDRSYERVPGGSNGHLDTDSNAADFAILAPSNPQNSASPCIELEEPTDPFGTGSADPASVLPGESSTLSVAVTPGDNPTSTGITVVADLSSIGGSATQPFADGDADGTFTYVATVAPGTPAGGKSLPVAVADAEGRDSTTSISLTVEAAPTQIWEIQGEAHLSSFDNQQVFGVEGIVTAIRPGSNGGIWMTDPTPDTDPNTSDGIFVFRGVAAVGDLVTVNGTVDEFRPGGAAGFENLTTTQIVSPTVTIVSRGHALPTTVIGVDRVPPAVIIDGDSTTSVEAADAVYNPGSDGIDFWESLEGMRLRVADAVAVGPRVCFGSTCASREIAVISQLQADAGARTPRGGLLVRHLGLLGNYRPGDFNPERLILASTLAPLPDVNAGDEFASDPIGVLDYTFGNFKLFVTENPGRVDNGLAAETTGPAGPHDLAVATFNVENLSAIDLDAKVNQLAAQIVTNLRSPDLVAIEEMQDNTGPANNGVVAADLSWQRLINAIVAAGGPQYDYRQIDPVDNADGGAPGGNIRVGFLFHSERGLEFVDRPGGNATTDTNVVATPNGKGAQLTISPGRVLPDPTGPWASSFELTRKSLAGEFRWRGETLFVVANHFSSKGDDEPLFGHSQPPRRLTEFQSEDSAGIEDGWRHAQAQVINDFVDEILAKDRSAHVIVLGDINDFDFSETVDVITGERVALNPGLFMPDGDGSGQTGPGGAAVMGTLFDQLPPDERYSYVFEGNSQVLDQILVSTSLLALGPRYDVVHVNAEFATQASDHDPSVMLVAFQPRGGRASSAARGR